MELAVIDFETTGIDAASDEILQVAIIDGTGKVLMNELCCPQHTSAWAGAQKVNGIAPERVAGCPPFAHFAPQVRQILASAKRVLAYNISFEQSFLRAAGIDPKAFRWADPMELFARAFGGQKRKLATAAGVFGIQFSAHDALEDVQATLALYRALEEGALRRIVSRGEDVVLEDGARQVFCRAPKTESDWLYAHKALGLAPITASEPRALVYKGLYAPAGTPCTLVGLEDHSADGDWLVVWVRADGRLLALDSDHLREMQQASYTPLAGPVAPQESASPAAPGPAAAAFAPAFSGTSAPAQTEPAQLSLDDWAGASSKGGTS